MKSVLRQASGRIDHPRRGSKDVIDSVVQAVYRLSTRESYVPMVKVIIV